MNKVERNSNIELLKVIATFLIVLHHFTQNFSNNYNNRIGDILIFFIDGHMGNLGICLFIVASAYYLVDDNKIRIEKLFI